MSHFEFNLLRKQVYLGRENTTIERWNDVHKSSELPGGLCLFWDEHHSERMWSLLHFSSIYDIQLCVIIDAG